MAIIWFKVIQVATFGVGQKLVCNFLLVNNTITFYLAPFPRYCRLLVKFSLSTRLPVFNTLI